MAHLTCRVPHHEVPDLALQMLKGRRSNCSLAEFGELVHFLIPKTEDMLGKFEDRWSEGLWLGCDVRSGEHLIGMDSGVFRVSTVRSKTADTRCSPDKVASMSGTPGKPVPGQSYNWSPAFTRKYGQAQRAHAEYAPHCRASDNLVMENLQERHRQAWGHTRLRRLQSHNLWQATTVALSGVSIAL